MELVWEQILNLIVDLPEDMQEETTWLAERVTMKIIKIMREESIGLKKVLELNVSQHEIDKIFANSGYMICEKCRKITEDDHKCQS